MLIEIIVSGVVAFLAYQGYQKVIADKLDSPANNQAVKGLEKAEIKEEIKSSEAKIKTLKEEIKTLENERKEILKGEEKDKNEKAQEKLEAKNEKIKELAELEVNLSDLKVVDQAAWYGWKPILPNKLTLNNGLWIGGFLLAIGIVYKVCMGVFRNIFLSINWGGE